MRLRNALLIGGSVLVLAGCGLRGDLEPAPPLWGDSQAAEPSPDEEAPEDPNAPLPIDPER